MTTTVRLPERSGPASTSPGTKALRMLMDPSTLTSKTLRQISIVSGVGSWMIPPLRFGPAIPVGSNGRPSEPAAQPKPTVAALTGVVEQEGDRAAREGLADGIAGGEAVLGARHVAADGQHPPCCRSLRLRARTLERRRRRQPTEQLEQRALLLWAVRNQVHLLQPWVGPLTHRLQADAQDLS